MCSACLLKPTRLFLNLCVTVKRIVYWNIKFYFHRHTFFFIKFYVNCVRVCVYTLLNYISLNTILLILYNNTSANILNRQLYGVKHF